MKQRMMTLNRLPAKTWNWLKMNESQTPALTLSGPCRTELEGGEGRGEFCGRMKIHTGMGQDMDRLMEMAGAPVRLYAKKGRETVYKLHLFFEPEEETGRSVELYAGEGSRMTVLMDFSSPREGEGLAAVQTRLFAEKGAVIRLVQIELLGDRYRVLNDIGGSCGENGTVRLLQLFLGGQEIFGGGRVELLGRESRLEAEIGYLGRSRQRFDFNYGAVHKGKRSESRITADGVLADSSFKLFRGTIDFRRGASGSKGGEQENALFLGENCVNQTIPLILCAEEDVQGSHGATIGRLSEELLFYLCTRGFSEDEAAGLLVRTKMDALSKKIGDAQAEAMIQEYLKEATGYGE